MDEYGEGEHMKNNAMHEHYKLDGTFVGEPKFKYHDEFQANAKEKVADKKDKKGKD